MKVYIFCSHTVPKEHPNGVRVANIGRILQEMGHEVFLFGSAVRDNVEHLVYKGLKCYVWPQKESSGVWGAIDRENRRWKYVKSVLEDCGRPDIIISCLFNCKTQRKLIQYSRKHTIPMVESVCEWFDKNNFSGLSGAVKFIDNRLSMHVQFPAIRNIIAISSLLEEYYHSRECNTVYLPTLVDMEDYVNLTHENNEKMIITYAGSPAKKDYIINAIYAIGLLEAEERGKIQLHLYGPKTEQLLALGVSEDYLNRHKDSIICHGRIPYEQVKAKLAAADFTVLLRPNKRYANAGFPTKVGESMACGTPVIANHTSDLHKYIIDGKTGVVCSDETAESCAAAFRRVLAMTYAEKKVMRAEALRVAQEDFCYKNYRDAFAKFLERCYAK